jgi:hypothetical protein
LLQTQVKKDKTRQDNRKITDDKDDKDNDKDLREEDNKRQHKK